jgi:hypothetical protein
MTKEELIEDLEKLPDGTNIMVEEDCILFNVIGLGLDIEKNEAYIVRDSI